MMSPSQNHIPSSTLSVWGLRHGRGACANQAHAGAMLCSRPNVAITRAGLWRGGSDSWDA